MYCVYLSHMTACNSYCSSTQDDADSAPLRNVNMNATVEMFPLSPRDYGMHISWYIPEEAGQLSGY